MDPSPRDALIMNSLQYDVSVGPEPFDGAAEALNVDVDDILRGARRLKEGGAVRRFGVSFNSMALGGAAALVLAAVPPDRALDYARIISSSGRSKHSYVRSFPGYNLWFTYRAASADALRKDVDGVLSSLGVDDRVVLATSRTYKLSVKYDLERGTSWSPPGILRADPPTLGELGVTREIARRLEDLPISRRPFRELAASVGDTEEGLLDLVEGLLEKGVVADFGAILEPGAVGIRRNAVVMGRGGGPECEALSREVPEATHVVLREPLDGHWDLRAYFVVHARDGARVESIVERAARLAGIDEYKIAYGEGGFTV
ncbi:MAG: hypothetical protein RXP97_00975 [Nitrososphaeria archaeon]